MPQAVADRIELAVAPLLIEAVGHNPLRVRRHLRFEQLDITVLQRVVALALVAAVDQEVTLTVAQQRQLRHVTLQPVHQRQQQALEFRQQPFDAAALEVTLVIRQVQAQVITGVAHSRQREVGMGTARVRGGLQVLGPVHDRHVHGRVLEHEQAVEQRLAFWQLTALLNRHQRQVFVLAQLHVVRQQLTQPLTHAQRLTVLRHLHPQGHAVNEQPDRVLHLRQLHRTTGHGHAEQHVTLAAESAQHQRPRCLSKGVDGQLMLLRQFPQPHTVLHLKTGVAIAHQHAAAVARMLAQERTVARDVGGVFKALQVALPPLVGLVQVLLLQPADVVTVARRQRQLRRTTLAQRAVDFKEITHEQ